MASRLLSALLLASAAPLLAQAVPDFSGVFLRDMVNDPSLSQYGAPPFILEISQAGDRLAVTARQNGAWVTSTYDLSGVESINLTTVGVPSKSRASIVERTLQLESYVPEQKGVAPTGSQIYGVKAHESWHLSGDRNTLTIERKVEVPGRLKQTVRETYTRQPSLDAALQRAEITSTTQPCMSRQGFLLDEAASFPKVSLKGKKLRSPPRQKYEGSVALGSGTFRQLSRCALFTAAAAADLFKGLERIPKPEGIEFRREQKTVTAYPDSIILDIQPSVWDCPPDGATLLPVWQDPRPYFLGVPVSHSENLPAEFMELRFQVRWIGTAPLDLGEVPAELRTEPWPELRAPEKFYRLQLPSKDRLLTDRLEIHVLSKSGEQIACILGHI
jgi:hypothetical protein